jgi:hypothetical protein
MKEFQGEYHIRIMFTSSKQAVISYSGRVEVFDATASIPLFNLLQKMAQNRSVAPPPAATPSTTDTQRHVYNPGPSLGRQEKLGLDAIVDFGAPITSGELADLTSLDRAKSAPGVMLRLMHKGRIHRRTRPGDIVYEYLPKGKKFPPNNVQDVEDVLSALDEPGDS